MADELGKMVLRWVADTHRWEEVPWSDWMAFMGVLAPSVGLPGLSGGIHHFVVVVSENEGVWNIIPHKYLIESDGRKGWANFAGWTDADFAEDRRLNTLREMSDDDKKRHRELQAKGGRWFDPPPEAIAPLRRSLPYLARPGSAAERFLREV